MGWEDLLEEEMAMHSSILVGKIPWTEEPGGLTVHGVVERLDCATEHTHIHMHIPLFLYPFIT